MQLNDLPINDDDKQRIKDLCIIFNVLLCQELEPHHNKFSPHYIKNR